MKIIYILYQFDIEYSIWKENQSQWKKSEIVVTTVQSLKAQNKYKRLFSRDDFSLVISDESHRSLVGQSKKVIDLHFLWLVIEY